MEYHVEYCQNLDWLVDLGLLVLSRPQKQEEQALVAGNNREVVMATGVMATGVIETAE